MAALPDPLERIAAPTRVIGLSRGRRARLAGLSFDRLTEQQVVGHVIRALAAGRGGWIATPNIDICQATRRDTALGVLIDGASLVVPDGMPLVWASRLRGAGLPERVTGASLISTLTEAAARHGRSIYLLGGEPGVAPGAASRLRGRYPGLIVAGTDAPPMGFDKTRQGIGAVRRKLVAAAPDIVYVGLGFPKQEQLIAQLAPALPHAWFVGCGAAIPFAAGTLRRAPRWMQVAGLEWTWRLLSEPRRLFKRYMVSDLPFAAGLLLDSATARLHRDAPPGRDELSPAGLPAPPGLPPAVTVISYGRPVATGLPAAAAHRRTARHRHRRQLGTSPSHSARRSS
jgi:N-acetylglucosaminyldiphosphoundecaprenol N-acetyl-beta-D-mannosaminyltransferase